MKKILFALLAVVVLASSLVVSTSAAEIPTDGLVGNYHFDMDWNNAVTGEAGIPLASGGMFGEGLYTDVMDPERYWFTGVEGQAFWCADGDGLQTINPGLNDWTIGVWIMEVANLGYTPYVWYGGQTQSSGENWIGIWNVNIENNTDPWDLTGVCVGSNDAAGTRLGIVPEVARYDTEGEVELQWTHVTLSAVLDAETDPEKPTYTITMYVNGEEAGSAAGFPAPGTAEDACVYINGVNAWGDKASSGALDELVIYNRALSADEVATLYGAYPTPATYETANDVLEAQVIREDESGDDTTAAPDDGETTAAPDDEGTTTAPADDDAATTDAPEEEGGCGSAMGAAAAIVALVSILGCAIVKKH